MVAKRVMRYDANQRMLRLVRFTWADGTRQLTIGLKPAVFYRVKEMTGTIWNVLGLRVHAKRSYGGRWPD